MPILYFAISIVYANFSSSMFSCNLRFISFFQLKNCLHCWHSQLFLKIQQLWHQNSIHLTILLLPNHRFNFERNCCSFLINWRRLKDNNFDLGFYIFRFCNLLSFLLRVLILNLRRKFYGSLSVIDIVKKTIENDKFLILHNWWKCVCKIYMCQ